MIGQLAFAFLAGSVATVNPCGFALLPAYLARRLAIKDDARNPSDAIGFALVAGGVMTFSVLTKNLESVWVRGNGSKQNLDTDRLAV